MQEPVPLDPPDEVLDDPLEELLDPEVEEELDPEVEDPTLADPLLDPEVEEELDPTLADPLLEEISSGAASLPHAANEPEPTTKPKTSVPKRIFMSDMLYACVVGVNAGMTSGTSRCVSATFARVRRDYGRTSGSTLTLPML